MRQNSQFVEQNGGLGVHFNNGHNFFIKSDKKRLVKAVISQFENSQK